jgi:hypothetical protein
LLPTPLPSSSSCGFNYVKCGETIEGNNAVAANTQGNPTGDVNFLFAAFETYRIVVRHCCPPSVKLLYYTCIGSSVHKSFAFVCFVPATCSLVRRFVYTYHPCKYTAIELNSYQNG